MSQESLQPNESQVENQDKTETNIVTLEHCKTVSEMIERVQEIKKQNEVSLVMLGEYTFNIDEITEQLEAISDFVKEAKIDILMAPDNEFSGGKSWGEIKAKFGSHDVEVEETEMLDNHRPETVGIFVYKSGKVFIFPKSWNLENGHRPIHSIPDTNIGVTICGEIGKITPEDLDNSGNIKIIYNPSREADDQSLKFRVLNRYREKPLTREEIAEMLMKEDYYQKMLDDSNYNENDPYPEYIPESDSREAREKKFNDAVEEYFQLAKDPKDSFYVKDISEKLKEKGISIVRCDGDRCSGILNETQNVKSVDYKEGHAVFKLSI